MYFSKFVLSNEHKKHPPTTSWYNSRYTRVKKILVYSKPTSGINCMCIGSQLSMKHKGSRSIGGTCGQTRKDGCSMAFKWSYNVHLWYIRSIHSILRQIQPRKHLLRCSNWYFNNSKHWWSKWLVEKGYYTFYTKNT